MITLTKDNFEQEVLKSTKLVLVDFYTEWCGPCKALKPTLEALSEDMGDVVFAKIDIDSAEELADEYNVMSVPTLKIFKDGVEMDSKVGAQSKGQLKSWLEKYL